MQEYNEDFDFDYISTNVDDEDMIFDVMNLPVMNQVKALLFFLFSSSRT